MTQDGFSFLNIDLQKGLSNSPFFILEFPFELTDSYSPVLKNFWGEALNSPVEFFRALQKEGLKLGACALSVYFNLPEPADSQKTAVLKKACGVFKEILNSAKMPLMIRLSGQAEWDCELARNIFPILDRQVIISPVQAANYEQIIDSAKKSGFEHYFVLRTPIDINLTKELNILSIDKEIKKERILIDPEMGCIGYGIDYGYSIIERICLARNSGDDMLDMPVIVCAGEESFKAKESKSSDFSASWGELEQRAVMWEISTASALVAAGANICVLWHPQSLKVLRKEYCGVLCH